MGFLDSLGNLFGGQETINWNQGGSSILGNGGGGGGLNGIISALQPLADRADKYNNQQQMNSVFAANPDFATKLYSAQNNASQVANQSALLQMQQQEQQQKLKQSQATQNLALQAADGGSPLEKLLAMSAPGTLGEYKIQQDKLAAERQRQQLISQIDAGQTPGRLQPPDATAGAASGSSPLSVRNNNPGNMKDPNTGDFHSFSSPEEGIAAMTKDLSLKLSGKSPVMMAQYGQGYTPTLNNLIPTWAPASDNNDPASYINAVSAKTGIQPNKPLTMADIGKLQSAMIHQEGGDAASQYFSGVPATGGMSMPSPQRAPLQAPDIQPTGQLQAPPQPPPELQKLALKAQLDPKMYGKLYTEQQLKWEEQQQKEAKANADSVITPDNEALVGQGKAFIDTIQDPDVRNKANALIRGDAPYPNITSRTPNNIKKALEAAQAADPAYSATTAPVRMQTAKSFAPSGNDGKVLQSIGTASGHIKDLEEAYNEIHNGGWKWINATKNKLAEQSDNPRSKAIAKFNTALNAVAPELAKISSGTAVVPEGEIGKRRDSFSYNMPPGVFKSSVEEAASLIGSRANSMIGQYKQTMNDELPKTAPKFSQEVIDHFKSLGVDLNQDGLLSGTSSSVAPTDGWSARIKQ